MSLKPQFRLVAFFRKLAIWGGDLLLSVWEWVDLERAEKGSPTPPEGRHTREPWSLRMK